MISLGFLGIVSNLISVCYRVGKSSSNYILRLISVVFFTFFWNALGRLLKRAPLSSLIKILDWQKIGMFPV